MVTSHIHRAYAPFSLSSGRAHEESYFGKKLRKKSISALSFIAHGRSG